MPNWKKLIVSGSDATLNSLNVITSISGSIISGSGTVSGVTGSFGSSGIQGSLILTDNAAESRVTALSNHLSLRTQRDQDDIKFYVGDNTSLKAILEGNTGRLGIGTSAPSTKLTVVSTANEDGIALKDSSGNLKFKVRPFGGNTYLSLWDSSNTENVRITSNTSSYFNGGNVGIGTTVPQFMLDVDGLSMLRTEADMWQSEQKFMRIGRFGRGTGTSDRQHYLTAKVSDSATENFISFNIDDGSTSNGTSYATNVLKLRGDSSAIFGGAITAAGSIHASGSSSEIITDQIFRAAQGTMRFRKGTNTWDAMSMSSNGKLELASGGPNDRGELVLVADYGATPRAGVIQFQNESQGSSFLFTDTNKRLKFHTSDPGEDDSLGEKVFYNNFPDTATFAGDVNVAGNIILTGASNEIIKSNGSIRLNIDSDNNQTDRIFIVSTGANSELFRVSETGYVTAAGTIQSTGGNLKLGADVEIFRDGANILRTDDTFHANNSIHVGGDGKIYDRANTSNFIELADTVNISTDTSVTGDLTVTGTLTAQQFNTELVSASIVFESGSTIFGNSSDDTHKFTGTVDLATYGSGNNTGTLAYTLGVDSSGNLIEFSGGSGGGTVSTITGGADNRVAVFNGSDSLEGDADFVFDGTNVGIGTTSPTRKLDVETSDDFVASFVSTDNKAVIEISDDDTTGYISSENGLFSLGRHAGVNAANININGSHNVGIGTSSPGAKLDVYGRVDFANDLRLRGTDSAADQGVVRFFVDSDNKLFIDTANDGSNRFVIDSSGNVGLGQNSPSQKLHVDGNIRVGDLNDVIYSNKFQTLSNSDLLITANTGYDTTFINGGSERMRIKTGGSVGIGTTAPSKTLHVFTTADQIAQFESSDASAKILVKDATTTAYINANSGNASFGPFSSYSDSGNIRIASGSEVHNGNGVGAFGTSPSTNTKWKVAATVDTSADSGFHNTVIDLNVQGSSALTGDKSYRGLNIDLDSSATGGDATNEVRLYGQYVSILDTGDADLNHGIEVHTENRNSDASATMTMLLGLRGTVKAMNTEGTISSMYGVDGIVNMGSATGGDIGTVVGVRGNVNGGNTNKTPSNVYGGFFKIDPGPNFASTLGTTRGVFSEIEIDGNTTTTNLRAIEGIIDLNTGSHDNLYQLKLDTQIHANASQTGNNFGIYSTGADKHYLVGNVGIGESDPDAILHIANSGNPTILIEDTDADNQVAVRYKSTSHDWVAGLHGGENAFKISAHSSFGTNDYFNIESNGDVGIGTTTPGYKLDVVGDINTSTGLIRRAGNVIVKSSGAETMIGPGGAGIISFHNSATMTTSDETARIDANGNLMLNNTSANARLDIREDSNYALRLEDASGHYFRVNTGGDTEIRGNVTVGGTITAQEFHTELVSASIVFESGSTIFGNSSDDTHQFQGSLSISGDGSNAATFTESGNGDFTIAAVDDIRLAAGGNDIVLRGASSAEFGRLANSSQDFVIKNITTDKDIILEADDGSGGTTPYIRLDGSDGMMKAHRKLRFLDSVQLTLGNADDLKLQHDGSNSYIQNAVGDLYIQQHADDKDIVFQSDDGSGGTTEYFRVDGGANKTLFFQNSEHQDGVKGQFGNSGDLSIQHNGSNSFITNDTGDLYIRNNTDDRDIIFESDDGSGGLAEYLRIDGSAHTVNVGKNLVLNADDRKIRFGASTDFELYHSSTSESYIVNNTGHLTIQNNADDKDIIFRSDNGSGGTQIYLELDGSTKSLDIGDGINVNYDNISTSNSGTVVRGGFLNPAAEANMVHLPHLINDLAGFNKWSNGTITTSGFYGTRNGSAGSYTYSNEIASNNSGWEKAFDAHSSTAGSWYSDNGSDGTFTSGSDTPGVVTLEWPNEAQYSLWAGIVFGSTSFTATYVKIEAYRGGAWQTLCEVTDNTDQVVLRQVGSNSGTGQATTKLRYTLGGSVNNSYFRIHSLYMANYRAGDNNLNNTGYDVTRGVNFIEKYKNGYLHGNFYPGADNTYDLGSSTYAWKDAYLEDWGSVSASLSTIQNAGGVNGSGTGAKIPKWSDSDTLTDSIMTEGTNTIQILSDGSGAAGAVLELKHANNNSTDVCATINLTNNTGGYAAIEGGTTGANNTGYINFKTDNAGTQGTVLQLNGDKSADFYGNVDIYTGTGLATLNIGRNASEKLQIDQTDNETVLTANNDADGDGDHNFRLNRVFAGSGANNFKIQKGGTDQLTIDTDGNVGIGTSSPKQIFHVSGGSTAGDVTKAVIGATGGNAESHLYLAENFSGDNVNWGFSFVADGNSSNNLLIKRHSNNTSGVTVLTINRDNNNASFSGELQVASNLDINGTSLTLSSAAITYQNNNDVDTGTETIATVVKANHDAAFFDYVVKNGTNLRAGTVMAVHDGTNVEFTDNSTKDIGDTSGVTFSVDISGTDLRLRATTTSDNWIIKSLVRSI